jgi:hypothetical protein
MAIITLNNNSLSSVTSLPAAIPTGKVLQVVTQGVTESTGTTSIPQDNTLPQSTEGTEIVSINITPASTSNKILIIANYQLYLEVLLALMLIKNVFSIVMLV